MLRIKLARTGRTKRPHYRILVLEKTKDPFGDYLENVGHMDPRTKEIVINKERVEYWISKGAQPTDRVHNILIEKGILHGKKKKNVSSLGKKAKKKVADAKTKEAEERSVAKATKQTEPKVNEETKTDTTTNE